MAKQTKEVRSTHLVDGKQGRGGMAFEHKESYDDSLLPSALELAKLNEIDPNAISWIKERTAKEQDGRLSFNERRITLVEKTAKRHFLLDIGAMACAFVIVMTGMGFSYALIDKGQTVVGTIFAGGTLIVAASAFLNYRKRPEKSN